MSKSQLVWTTAIAGTVGGLLGGAIVYFTLFLGLSTDVTKLKKDYSQLAIQVNSNTQDISRVMDKGNRRSKEIILPTPHEIPTEFSVTEGMKGVFTVMKLKKNPITDASVALEMIENPFAKTAPEIDKERLLFLVNVNTILTDRGLKPILDIPNEIEFEEIKNRKQLEEAIQKIIEMQKEKQKS